MSYLSKKDWRAIADALAFTLATWDSKSHSVSREDMEAAFSKARERSQ